MISESLNRFVPWVQLLQTLGVTVKTQALPAAVTCPKCKNSRCLIFQNRPEGGQWHYCQDCKIHGDMIELAASVWRIDEASAVIRLVNEGLPIPANEATRKKIEEYITWYPRRRKKIDAGWENLRTSAIKPTLRKRMSSIHMWHQLGNKDAPQRWFVGGATRTDMESLLFDKARHAIFGQRGWTDTVAFPFYVAPGQLSGFLCIGRNNEFPVDYVFAPVTRHTDDCGLWMPENLTECARAWGNTVLVTKDIPMAVNLQLRNLNTSNVPLPIVLYYDTPELATTDSFEMLSGYRQVFWTPTIDAATIKHAVASNAHVARVGGKAHSESPTTYKKMPATDVLDMVFETSSPWYETIRDRFEDLPDHSAENLLLSLQMHNVELETVLSRLPEVLSARLRNLIQHRAAPKRTLMFDGYEVYETPEGWFADGIHRPKTTELISDAVIRIEKVVHHKRTNTTYFSGHIKYKDLLIPYTVERDYAERYTAKWLQDVLFQNGGGLLQHSPRWIKKALALGARFATAKYLEATDRVGWDSQRGIFVFPTFQINDRGVVTANDHHIATAKSPCTNLPAPTDVTPADLDSVLLANGASWAFWALFVQTAQNALAPAFGEAPELALVYAPDAVIGVAGVLQGLGCLYEEPDSVRRILEALDGIAAHSWPKAIRPRPSMQLEAVKAAHTSLNCLLFVDPPSYTYASFISEQTIINIPESPSPAAITIGGILLSAYLQDVCNRNLLVDSRESFSQMIADDVVNWVERTGGDSQAVRWAIDSCVTKSNKAKAAEMLVDMLLRETLDGRAPITPEGFVKRTACLVSVGKKLLIRIRAIHRLTPKKIAGELKFEQIDELLKLAVNAKYDDEKEGWLVDLNDWLDRLADMREQDTIKLHIA